MRLAQTDQTRRRRSLKHSGIPIRHASRQQLRSRLGRHASRIEQIFPTDRHAVQQGQPLPAARTRGGGGGLGQRTVTGDAGIDAVAQVVAFDGV